MDKLDLNSLTEEQAKAYQEELQDAELTPEALEKVAGGWEKTRNPNFCKLLLRSIEWIM